jgi:peptide/nickel transport system ATP-binding protein
VDRVSFTVAPGQVLGVLGESGSGKSTIAKALLGMADDAVVEGAMSLGGLDLGALGEEGWNDVRWRRISLAFQSTASLNPVLRIGLQMTEPLQLHLGLHRHQAEQRAVELLEDVCLGDWVLDRYPSELSGGQRRLVLLALALACEPEVLLLDEPTAGLDGVTRTRVEALLRGIAAAGRTAMVIFGHDIDTFEALATDVAVLYRGWMAETGPAGPVLSRPQSPYTWALLNARPTLGSIKELRAIPGDPYDQAEVASGCPFLGRCRQAVGACGVETPRLDALEGGDGRRMVACVRGGVVTMLDARGLRKTYNIRQGFRRDTFVAVEGIDVRAHAGEVVGIVGSTGAGKSTLAMMLLRVLEPDGGTVSLEGTDLLAAQGAELKALRGGTAFLFQDPFEALSPRFTVAQAVREPLDVQGIGTGADRDARVAAMLHAVHLPTDADFLSRHTHELSGGQLQRVALARALVLEPRVVVADEPVSMLDPSEAVRMLQLLKQLQVERGIALVVVSHDLATILRIADHVLVVDRGRVVEEGAGRTILEEPRHPVTRALLIAAGARGMQETGAPIPALVGGPGRSGPATLRSTTPDRQGCSSLGDAADPAR